MLASQAREALTLVTDTAVADALTIAGEFGGTPGVQRAAILETIPPLISYYSDGSAALAADYYMDERIAQATKGPFTAAPVVTDRVVRIRRGLVWASDPLFADMDPSARLKEIVQSEVARPFRDTITANRKADGQCVGWRRVTGGHGCGFCQMLAENGAVYKAETARFASHTNCDCTAQPVFVNADPGVEASLMQYKASKRRRTEAEKEQIRSWVAFYEGR